MTFYKLTPEMGKYLRQYLTGSEWKLWSYLATLDPFGDKYLELPNTLTVLIECNISKRSFYRAIAKFQELELFDFQDKGFHFRNVSVPKEDNSHDMDWHNCATIGTNDATVGTNNATIGTTSIYQELQTDQTSLETRTREKKRRGKFP